MKNNREHFIVVTGAAGFVGSHLIESLLFDKIPVIGIDNFDPFYPRQVKETNLAQLRAHATSQGTQFLFFEKDIVNFEEDFLRDLEVAAIFHLAARAGVRPSLQTPQEYLKTNTLGTLQLLEYCRRRHINKFVFGSSSSVYGNDTPPFREESSADRPLSPYAASKRAAELYCSTYASLYGLKIAALRIFTVYGPRQRPDLAIHKFAKLISEQKTVHLYGDGTSSRDYTYVSDIVTGLRSSMKWIETMPEGTFDIFNLGGASSTPLKRLVELLEDRLKMKAEIQWAPKQPGEVERTCADISKSHKILEFSPKVGIEEGITRFTEWFGGNTM